MAGNPILAEVSDKLDATMTRMPIGFYGFSDLMRTWNVWYSFAACSAVIGYWRSACDIVNLPSELGWPELGCNGCDPGLRGWGARKEAGATGAAGLRLLTGVAIVATPGLPKPFLSANAHRPHSE